MSLSKIANLEREVQRAIAVKMLLCGYKHEQIRPVLGVSSGFISKWKKAFFQNGVEGLKLAPNRKCWAIKPRAALIHNRVAVKKR